jgi:sugar-specific transcriptional regulator TrmB
MQLLIESLQQLGLTAYEAKILAALTQYGSRNAADLHTLSGVPRSAVYGVIDKLKNRGLIEIQNSKPMRYKAQEPERIITLLTKDYAVAVDFSLEQLENIYQKQEGTLEDNSAWNINGVKNVTDKILQMLESSNKEIIFSSSYVPLNQIVAVYPIMGSIWKEIREKISEGVKVKITVNDKIYADEIATELPGAEVKVYNKKNNSSPLMGGILSVDEKELLVVTVNDEIFPPNLNATWYCGKEHVRVFRHFIDAEWNQSASIE